MLSSMSTPKDAKVVPPTGYYRLPRRGRGPFVTRGDACLVFRGVSRADRSSNHVKVSLMLVILLISMRTQLESSYANSVSAARNGVPKPRWTPCGCRSEARFQASPRTSRQTAGGTRSLSVPRDSPSAAGYVLLNVRKHWLQRNGDAPPVRLDAASSGAWFDGWRRPPPATERRWICEVAPPRTWVLREGWRRHGLVDPAEVPGFSRLGGTRTGRSDHENFGALVVRPSNWRQIGLTPV